MSKRLLLPVLLFVIFILFVWVNISQLDPDFGWHLKMGERILNSGIPKTDPFSHTMPGYPFVDHEWLSNVVIYFLYQWTGYPGLAVVYALLLLSVPLVILRKKIVATVPLLLIFSVLMFRAGIRPQVESWVLFGVLLGLLWNEKGWRLAHWFIPVLLLLWVNLHGSFPLGLVVLGIYLVCQTIAKRRIDPSDIVVLVFSVIATFISPYGWRNWWEVYMQMTDPLLHRYILEWLPFYSVTDLGFIATACFLLGMLKFLSDKLPQIWKLVLLFLLFVFSLSAVRHMPFFVFAGALIIADSFDVIYKQAFNTPWGRARIGRIQLVFVLFTGVIFITVTAVRFNSSTGSGNSFYPAGVVSYLQKHNVDGNLFNYYTWGGYLIWQLPEYKVFIDGRMPSFRFHYKPGESEWILAEYLKVMQGKDVEKIFRRYNVGIVLVPKPGVRAKQNAITRIATYFGLIHNATHDSVLVNLLVKKGWNICYKDEAAILLFDKNKACN